MDTLKITDDIAIPLELIALRAIRSQGSGGQNVNKVATAIQLKFDSQNCDALPQHVKERLLRFRDQRISRAGIVTIKSQNYRRQSRNKDAALSRLQELLLQATKTRRRRIATRPSAGAKKKRLENKSRQSDKKRQRRSVTRRRFDD